LKYNFLIKKNNVYYYFLVLIPIVTLINHYPNIYGKDAFQVIWIANAFREGALFSPNTWLISPFSYFGYFPFSHWPVGVPMVLAFLISLFNFISFGFLGIYEAILVLNILLILIIYKSTKNLGKMLFEEEWSRFIFVAAILFSMYVSDNVTMTVSTRIIITIIIIFIIKLNIKVLNKSINKVKATIFFFFLLLIGALTHRLWVGMLIPIIIMLLTVFIRKYKKLHKIILFLILPLSLISFFVGLEIISEYNYDFLSRLDPNETFSPFLDENSLFGMIILICWFSIWNLGIISIFFPVGVILMIYKLINLLEKSNELNSLNYQKYYLILFSIPFSFLLPATFYSIIIFFPILIIFSIYGIIYFKKIISKYSENLSWVLLIILLSISIIYSILKVRISTGINLNYFFVLLFVSIIMFILVFIVNKYKLFNRNIILNSFRFKKQFWTIFLTISILIFSIITIETNRTNMCSSTYPWENSCLTNEEIEIIEFFQNEEINGLIFSFSSEIANKISGVGFLPVFNSRVYIGKALWYGLISPNEVIKNTEFLFLFSNILDQSFFRYWPDSATYYYETSPFEVLMRNIISLNMSYQKDRDILRTHYNVQFIISMKNILLESGINWTLIQSLWISGLEPVFSTQNLLVWEIKI